MPSARYGVKIRKRESKYITSKNTPTDCPKCGKKRVTRTETGIWKCTACKATYAGGAYSLKTG